MSSELKVGLLGIPLDNGIIFRGRTGARYSPMMKRRVLKERAMFDIDHGSDIEHVLDVNDPMVDDFTSVAFPYL